MALRLAALLPTDGMRIVEADQPLAIRPVQGQRVVDTMGLLRRDLYTRDDEPDPVSTLRIHDKNLPVEIEKQVEGQITYPGHRMWLSH